MPTLSSFSICSKTVVCANGEVVFKLNLGIAVEDVLSLDSCSMALALWYFTLLGVIALESAVVSSFS